jgi:hypothetical protein
MALPMLKNTFVLSLLITIATTSGAQHQKDTARVSASIANMKLRYAQALKGQMQLYDGSDYVEYVPLKEEHPYFLREDWFMGTIQYNAGLFENVPLLYNIYTDKVIAEHFYAASMIQLVSEKIDYFILDGHKFVQLQDPSITRGFYELLSDGKVRFYARHRKEFQESISLSEIQREFMEKHDYYIFKDGTYHSVKTKKSVLKVLGDHKKEINQYIRSSRMHFSPNRDFAIKRIVDFYNTKY